MGLAAQSRPLLFSGPERARESQREEQLRQPFTSHPSGTATSLDRLSARKGDWRKVSARAERVAGARFGQRNLRTDQDPEGVDAAATVLASAAPEGRGAASGGGLPGCCRHR